MRSVCNRPGWRSGRPAAPGQARIRRQEGCGGLARVACAVPDRRGHGRIGPQMNTNLEHQVVTWYRDNRRDLPWRQAGAGAWAVMVSEFMLQQTPVSRVLPAYLD